MVQTEFTEYYFIKGIKYILKLDQFFNIILHRKRCQHIHAWFNVWYTLVQRFFMCYWFPKCNFFKVIVRYLYDLKPSYSLIYNFISSEAGVVHFNFYTFMLMYYIFDIEAYQVYMYYVRSVLVCKYIGC